ncbi:MAG: HEAT repeat domain-containing protein [Polyangiaceae bacterium]|nr:HEAT repeat domain-containing protein [Polyangiaceae bacterium]
MDPTKVAPAASSQLTGAPPGAGAPPASGRPPRAPTTELLGISLTRVELERTALLFCLLFLAALMLVVGRTARDALFLSRFPVRWVAPMWIAYGAASSLAALAYAAVADRLPRARFAVAFALFGAATYAALRVLIGEEIRAAYLVFYVWSEIIANFTAVLVWAIAQDLHDPRSAKRLFGLIGSGRVLGTIACGLGAGAVVPIIGTANLLLVLVLALLLVAWLIRLLAARHALPALPTPGEQATLARLQHMPVWRSRYAVTVALFTLVLFAVLTIGDYQFKAIASATYPARDDLARFMGFFYGAVGAFGLLVQLAVMPRLLRRWGVLGGMLVMPSAFVAATAALLGAPSLAFAAILKASDNGLQFTVHDATTQLLLFPFPPTLRERVRALASAVAKPLGYGLGALLLILVAPPPSPAASAPEAAARLSYWSLPLGLLAIGLIPLVRRGYLDAMRRTLIRREADTADVAYGPHTRAIFLEALRSQDSPQVLFAITELRKHDAPLVRDELTALARHRSARVRALAVRLAAELDHPDGAALARAAIADRSPDVRAAAVESLAAILREDAHDELLALVTRDGGGDDALRAAAIAALVRHCGLDGMLDGAPRLRALLESPSPTDRVAAAHVLGRVGAASLQRALARLLADPDPGVRRAAVRAAASCADARLLPRLADALADRALALAAARAIAALGDPAVPELEARLADPHAPRPARLVIPRVLARIGTPGALAVLLSRIGEPDDAVRQKVLASASRLRLALRAPPAPLPLVRARIDVELTEHERARDAYLAVRARVAGPLLEQHVFMRLRKGLIRVLRLCELAYPRETVALARAHLFGPDPTLRANAFEILESLLDRPVRERLVKLVDRFLDLRASPLPRSAAGLDSGAPERRAGPARDDVVAAWIRIELARGEPYGAALALDAVAHHGITAAAGAALAATRDPDPLIREAAAIAVAVTRPPGARERLTALLRDDDPAVARYALYWSSTGRTGLDRDDTMYTTIEKILFLQRVPLFSRVAGDDLVALARGSIVVALQKGDLIFRQGEPGGSLYSIISGKVSLTIDGREIAVLGPDDVFGEMSIFDREPRTSTATVAEDAELLRVSAEDFHEAVHETVEIAEAVIQILNRRLRDADRLLVEARSRLSLLAQAPEPPPPPSEAYSRREDRPNVDDPDIE